VLRFWWVSAVASKGLNASFDRLARTRFGRLSREVPAFRSCGVVGFYLAVIAVIAGGLLRGQSLLVLGVLSSTCALSFYAWAWLRRALTSREELVLLEHVWVALLLSWATLRVLKQPSLPYLDVVAVGLAFFLAAGRVGCLVVGCCHGKPSSTGIIYGPEHARDGFAAHLVGVRLFPVPALESLGLFAIGTLAFLALRFAPAGYVLAWFLAAYSVMRFGLEGLRGDRRAHFLGISLGRWMAIAELIVAIATVQGGPARDWLRTPPALAALAFALLFALSYGVRSWRSMPRRLLRREHLASLRSAVSTISAAASSAPSTVRTAEGMTLAVSTALGEGWLVSLRLPDGAHDLALLCAVAGQALPELRPEASRVNPDGTLVLLYLRALRDEPPAEHAERTARADALYGSVVTQLQALGREQLAPTDQLTAFARPPESTPVPDSISPPAPIVEPPPDFEQSVLWSPHLHLSLSSRIQHKS